MILFKYLSRSTAKVIGQVIVILLILQLFIQVEANNAENSSQPDLLGEYTISNSLDYEEFMTSSEKIKEHCDVKFFDFTVSQVLNILRLSIINGRLCEMPKLKDLTQQCVDGGIISIGPRYVQCSDLRNHFSEVEFFHLTLSSSVHSTIIDIANSINRFNTFLAMELLFHRFLLKSQNSILERFHNLLSCVLNNSEPKSIETYISAFKKNQWKLETEKLDILISLINSLFAETIIVDCVRSLSVNLSKITINIHFNSLICLNIAEHLECFSELTSIHLGGSYFNNAEMNIIESLNILPNCNSITFGNGTLTDLFFDYLERHVNGCTEENLTGVTNSLGFTRLSTLNLTLKGVNLNINKFLLLKETHSHAVLSVNIMHFISDESIKELEKHFNKVDCITITYIPNTLFLKKNCNDAENDTIN